MSQTAVEGSSALNISQVLKRINVRSEQSLPENRKDGTLSQSDTKISNKISTEFNNRTKHYGL